MLKATLFIVLDSHRCTACWQCIDECPKKVIGKFDFFFHKHSRIENPENCIGCKKCVKKCPNQAIYELSSLERYVGRSHRIVAGRAIHER